MIFKTGQEDSFFELKMLYYYYFVTYRYQIWKLFSKFLVPSKSINLHLLKQMLMKPIYFMSMISY